MTDAAGQFELHDVLPYKTFVLVQHPGFRFQGWPVDPAAQAGETSLTLVRSSETPDRKLTPLAEPIPLDEVARPGLSRFGALPQCGTNTGPVHDHGGRGDQGREYVRSGPRTRSI